MHHEQNILVTIQVCKHYTYCSMHEQWLTPRKVKYYTGDIVVLIPFSFFQGPTYTPGNMSYVFQQEDLPRLDLQVDSGTDFTTWKAQWDAYV